MDSDAIHQILTAIAAGTAAGATALAKDSVVEASKSTGRALADAKTKLTELLRSRFAEDQDARADLDVFARRPSVENAEALTGHLVGHGIDRDTEVLEAAHQVNVFTSAAFGDVATSVGMINQTADRRSANVGTNSGTVNIGAHTADPRQPGTGKP